MTAFVYLGATREDNIDRLSSLADGGAYPAVKPELVVATTCVLPTDSVMQEFDEVARPLLDSIGSNSAQGPKPRQPPQHTAPPSHFRSIVDE